MELRCKVTFYDVEHKLRGSVELFAASPALAAKRALQTMLDRDFFVTDFGESVHVEVLSRAEHLFQLSRLDSLSLTEPQRAPANPEPSVPVLRMAAQ